MVNKYTIDIMYFSLLQLQKESKTVNTKIDVINEDNSAKNMLFTLSWLRFNSIVVAF